MKHFIKGLFALLLALLVAAPADAGWNLRQNADGTTDWVRSDSRRVEDKVPVGVIYLTLSIPSVSTAATYALAIPVTDVKLTLVQSVLTSGVTTTDTILRFWNLGAGQTIGVLTASATSREISNRTAPLTIAVATNDATVGTLDTFTPTHNNNLERGSVILISTDGGSTDSGVGASPAAAAILTFELTKR